MLVGQCSRCGKPAALACTVCGRTFCRDDLDADERICSDCAQVKRNPRSSVESRPPPSRPLHRGTRAPGRVQ